MTTTFTIPRSEVEVYRRTFVTHTPLDTENKTVYVRKITFDTGKPDQAVVTLETLEEDAV